MSLQSAYSLAPNFSHSQSHHQRNCRRCSGRRGRRIQRYAHYRSSKTETSMHFLGTSRPELEGPEHTHQARRQACCHLRRHLNSRRSKRGSLALIKPDESTHIDELVERLDPEVPSSEIFAALFELEFSCKFGISPLRISSAFSGDYGRNASNRVQPHLILRLLSIRVLRFANFGESVLG